MDGVRPFLRSHSGMRNNTKGAADETLMVFILRIFCRGEIFREPC